MKDFYRTAAGRRFFESDIPALIEALQKISTQLEKANELGEKKRREENIKEEKRLEKMKI